MAWLKLTTTAKSSHRAMLLKAFPVEVNEYAANAQWSKNDWARGLEERYPPDGDAPVAWLEVISGNLVIVEVVGAEEREGVVQARLWVQASQVTVDLLGGKIVRYGNRSQTRSEAVASVVALVVEIAALDLPAEPAPNVDVVALIQTSGLEDEAELVAAAEPTDAATLTEFVAREVTLTQKIVPGPAELD